MDILHKKACSDFMSVRELFFEAIFYHACPNWMLKFQILASLASIRPRFMKVLGLNSEFHMRLNFSETDSLHESCRRAYIFK